MQPTKKLRLAIFSSGAGSNAQKIITHFASHTTIEVALVVSNKKNAVVCNIANAAGIAVLIIEKEVFFRGDTYLATLQTANIDFIALAGFLWKIPMALIVAYPNRIVNIHPALLPKYGGKGMYGNFVHEAVIAAGEKESGITIHFVDDKYDHGKIIFQTSCVVKNSDTPYSLATKIHSLEHLYFARIIEESMLAMDCTKI